MAVYSGRRFIEAGERRAQYQDVVESHENHWLVAPVITRLVFFQKRRVQQRAFGHRLYNKGVLLGRDDSLLRKGDTVYVINCPSPLMKIDYFPLYASIPQAVMCDDQYDMIRFDWPTYDIIGQQGCFAKAVISIQRSFRSKRNRRMLTHCRLLPVSVLAKLLNHIAGYIGRSYTACA